jgi:hypothetical protein
MKAGSIAKIEAAFFGSPAGHRRFQEDVSFRLSNKFEYGRYWPGKHSTLLARECGDNLAPPRESILQAT